MLSLNYQSKVMTTNLVFVQLLGSRFNAYIGKWKLKMNELAIKFEKCPNYPNAIILAMSIESIEMLLVVFVPYRMLSHPS